MNEIHFHLESARWTATLEAAIHAGGWAFFRDGTPIQRFVAIRHGEIAAVCAPRERPDVQSHFPGTPHAGRSGWEFTLAHHELDTPIDILAQDHAGRSSDILRIDPRDLTGRGPLLGGFATWSARYDPCPAPVVSGLGPLFSLLVPLYRTPRPLLEACVRSVQAQHHQRWELRLVDDSGEGGDWRDVAASYARADPRIHFHVRTERGGIARATNDALQLARGDFIALLDHDDELRPHALAEFARLLADRPATDAVYSDEAVMTCEGRPVVPFLKPAWSPEFLRGVMYVGHLLVVRASVAREAGGFDPAFDGVQDFEFMLRVGELTSRIEHLPRILYHWRQSPASSALAGNIKGDMDARQLAAVEQHLARIGDTRRPISFGGHRVQLRTRDPVQFRLVSDFPSLAQATEGAHEVIVFVPDHLTLDSASAAELAALAARPDSGVVAPVLIAPDGRVALSGVTTAANPPTAIMAGFDADGDGYNGSLRCNREVAAVAPACFAVRRTLASELQPEGEWWHSLARMAGQGLRHRVCSVAQAYLIASPLAAPSASGEIDPWFNAHFDPSRGDYSLRCPPAHFIPLRWHLDTPIPATLTDGCLELRGWAVGAPDTEITLYFSTGEIAFSLSCHQVREDVNAELGRPAEAPGGFHASLRLSSGQHKAEIRFESGPAPLVLWSGTIHVPATAALHRVWRTPPHRLLACQLPAAPTGRARPIRPESFPEPRLPPEKRPRLALVTPSFQQVRFIEQTITSVLQTGTPLQYVLQDGGSTDGTLGLLEKYRPRLHACESASDAGQADAIAKGFAKTTGRAEDLMAWINSDDFYLPGALDYVAEYFARHPRVDVVYGHRILVDAASREIGRWFLPPHDDEVLRLNDFVPQESLFWRRRLWDRVGGIDPTFQFAMDWDLLLRFQLEGAKIVRVPYFLSCFRIHPAQKTSARMHRQGQREIDLLRERSQRRRIDPQELTAHPRLARYLRHSAFLELLDAAGWRARF